MNTSKYDRQFDAITELEATGLIGKPQAKALLRKARLQRDEAIARWDAARGTGGSAGDRDETEAAGSRTANP
jgi:hypothetical protein